MITTRATRPIVVISTVCGNMIHHPVYWGDEITNWGFVAGCTILAIAIFASTYYINRAIQSSASWIAALKDKKL